MTVQPIIHILSYEMQTIYLMYASCHFGKAHTWILPRLVSTLSELAQQLTVPHLEFQDSSYPSWHSINPINSYFFLLCAVRLWSEGSTTHHIIIVSYCWVDFVSRYHVSVRISTFSSPRSLRSPLLYIPSVHHKPFLQLMYPFFNLRSLTVLTAIYPQYLDMTIGHRIRHHVGKHSTICV